MPRNVRKKSQSGIYHAITRGINRQQIFHSEEDCRRYLEILERIKDVSGCEIYGYCLMGNHVHLLVKENKEGIGQIMKRLGTSYAYWYNLKYERLGHVFQDRYKSECVEDEKYLLTVIRYIHNNPVKAGMVKKPEQYRWSSYSAYCGGIEYPTGLTQTHIVLELFSEDRERAVEQFRRFMQQENDDICLDDEMLKRATDEETRAGIQKLLKGREISTLKYMKKAERDSILKQAKDIEGSSIRQISRITGIGYNIIARA
ncbi:MAG: transposase [Bacillota bacterium]|nr:transposase [Bacillota bacterium]